MKNTLENRENAQAVLDYLEKYPEKHDQQNFWAPVIFAEEGSIAWRDAWNDFIIQPLNACDTTMCIAGTAVFLKEGSAGMVRCLDPELVDDFETKGAEHLGLDEDEAYYLFYQMNEQTALDALRAVANGDENKFADILGIS